MKQLLLFLMICLFSAPVYTAAAMNESSMVVEIINIDNDDEFSLLTNPVNDGTLKLKVNKTVTKNVTVTIINSLGEQIYSAKSSVNKPVLNFDVSNIAAGIYFLRIQGDSNSTVKKLIIQ